MKIGLVCPFNMLDRPGGIPQVVIHLYQGLKKNGHEVKVITQRPTSYKGDVPEDYILLGVTRTFKGGFGTEGNWAWPSDSSEIEAVLKREKFDVINFHEPWMPMLAWQMVRKSKAAHIGTFHANLMDTNAGKAWTLLKPYGVPLISSMDLITATSPASSGMLLSRADELKNSPRIRHLKNTIRYIPCGVELSYYKPAKKRQPLSGPGTKTIVYVGRIEKRKGTDLLLQAFVELNKQMPEAHLIIAGRGLWLNKLRQVVEDESIPNVEFPGYVTDDEKLHLLQNADLAVFPSTYGEGFGIVLLEAMAVGTPLLAGNNLGYINVMKGFGRIGLVDPAATLDFANRMAVFLTDNQLRKTMVDWALSEVKQYDYPKIVAQYEDAYKTAMVYRDKHHKTKKKNEREKPKRLVRRLFVRRHA